MNQKRLKHRVLFGLVLFASMWFCLQGTGVGLAQSSNRSGSEKSIIVWKSPAKLHRTIGSEKGDVVIGVDGIEFRSAKGQTIELPYLEVQTFHLSPHSLWIETYQNRKMHLPGIERLRFDVSEAVPPEIAAELSNQIRRPSQNAVPDTTSQGIAIPAHHRTVRGGTNGTLRLRDSGIDYVTSVAGDSRSWRWADLQTLSAPDPYHLLVFGFRDTYSFDLKELLSQSQFYRLVDALDSHHAAESGQGMDPQSLNSSEKRGLGAGNE
jgi:hypothetical protein